MPRTRLNRVGLMLTAMFQLLLPTLASVADARAEAASERGAFAHVESHSSSSCVSVHAMDCALCRVIAGGAVGASAPAMRVLPERAIVASLPPYHCVAVSALARCGPSQRAPPVGVS